MSNFPEEGKCKVYDSIIVGGKKYEKVEIDGKVYEDIIICNTPTGERPITNSNPFFEFLLRYFPICFCSTFDSKGTPVGFCSLCV